MGDRETALFAVMNQQIRWAVSKSYGKVHLNTKYELVILHPFLYFIGNWLCFIFHYNEKNIQECWLYLSLYEK